MIPDYNLLFEEIVRFRYTGRLSPRNLNLGDADTFSHFSEEGSDDTQSRLLYDEALWQIRKNLEYVVDDLLESHLDDKTEKQLVKLKSDIKGRLYRPEAITILLELKAIIDRHRLW